MKHRTLAAVAALAAAVVAGCGASGSAAPASTAPASTPAATPSAPRATYDDVTQLRDAAVAAGMSCPAWDQDNRVKDAASSGQCSDADVLSVYLTPQDASDAAVALKQVGGSLTHLLVGQNWIINDTDAAVVRRLQSRLGGMLVNA